MNIDNVKIIDCSKEPKSTMAPWTMPTWAPTKTPSFIDRPTPPPRYSAKAKSSTEEIKIETPTEAKDALSGWFDRYKTSTTSTVKTTTEEATTPSKAQVQTLPADWGDKKLAAIRTEARTEDPEEDIEGLKWPKMSTRCPGVIHSDLYGSVFQKPPMLTLRKTEIYLPIRVEIFQTYLRRWYNNNRDNT